MKELKNTDRIIINKNQLNEYLSDFEPCLREEYYNDFKEYDFDKGVQSFIVFMRSKIGMPKIGKNALNYWIKRGWDSEKAKELRVKIKSDPSKSPMNINFWLKKGLNEEEALFKIRSQRKMNIEYWLEKGYSEEESEKRRIDFQKKSNSKFITKYKTDIEFRKKLNSKKNNRKEYWLNKGYSEEEAIKLISKRQRTFSKDICIEKHGLEKGLFVWEERQKKWLKSLEESDYDLVSGKSVTIKQKIDNYDIDRLIDSVTLKYKDLFREIFKKSKSIDEFINNYMDSFDMDDVSLYRLLLPIKRLKLLHEYYNTTESYIMSLIIPKTTRVKSKYSYISWFNNHICRSDAEYILANFLVKNDIEYIYEKKYDNSKYRCDFYLTKYEIYIEYLGMKPKSYVKKIKFLKENKIKHITSSNIEYIKNKIIEIC
jgi:hypothetical protein